VAAPAAAVEAEPEYEPELEPAPVAVPAPLDSCRIAWWRGYVRSRFYAYEGNGDGEAKVVAESPLFSWHSSEPPPETPAALAAHARLVATLEGLGWEPDGRGDDWFSGRFVYSTSARNRRVRSSLGEEKNSSGEASSTI
jgi:hypothetical protein